MRETALKQTSKMNNALAEEERDEIWATAMEESLLTTSSKDAYAGSTFNQPTCKSTFCQIEVYHTNLESRDQFENIRREIPNSYHIQHFEDSGGALRSVMYVIKEGEEANNAVFNTLNQGG